MREYEFELRLCAHLEARTDWIIGRQLGAGVRRGGGRVMDVVGVVPGPEFAERVRLTERTIPPEAIESAASVGTWRPITDILEVVPAHARRVAEHAIDVGFFEYERRGGKEMVRQVARYPDWVDRLVGVENKPDLGTPGGLERQLRLDASLGLLDEVVLATESYITGAHRNRIPEEVGIWRVDFDDGDDPVTVVREPTALPVDRPGVERLADHSGRTDVRVVNPTEKAIQRRRVAERAYGKGWRTYELPACGRAEATEASGTPSLPGCRWKGRLVDPAAECGPGCAGYDPADPPPVDLAAERERRTAWDADPPGAARRQTGLDRFG